MVSFSCESCNDVLTKKKLDAHRNQCRGATFTCLDCMKHFRGTEYRSHTSCISEAQKYQGHLYQPGKESKKSKAQAAVNGTTIVAGGTQGSRKAYVEDAPDAETGTTAVAIAEPPPPAPSPPRAASSSKGEMPPVNVFDFLVKNGTPNASTANLKGQDSSKMVDDVTPSRSVGHELQKIAARDASRETFGESQYEERGYHYGTGPVPVGAEPIEYSYITPDPRKDGTKRQSKKDKKRKRQTVEELDLSLARPNGASDGDEMMTDAPPILHTGLTGGLNRMLSRPSEYPPSPEYSSGGAEMGDVTPGSPIKRTRRIAAGEKGATASTALTKQGSNGVSNRMAALVPVKRTSSTVRHADGPRLRTKHRHHHSGERHHSHKRRNRHGEGDDEMVDDPHDRSHSHSRRGRKRKAIEAPPEQPNTGSDGQLVVYRSRIEHFSSFITKGPDSGGCSINKVLKRYHRERDDMGLGLGRHEEEKELWKMLRLRKNERGEIVLVA